MSMKVPKAPPPRLLPQEEKVGLRGNFRSNAKGRIVVIPDHGSQVIVRPLLRKILRDLGLSVEGYTRLLEEQ